MNGGNPVITVEVACTAPRRDWPELSCIITSYVRSHCTHCHPIHSGDLIPFSGVLSELARSIRVVDMSGTLGDISTVAATATYVPFLFYLHSDRGEDEEDENNGNSAVHHKGYAADTDEALPACTILSLPHVSLEGLWDSLYYGETEEDSTALKNDLLQYMNTALYFSMSGVDTSRIAFNRLLLFHGIPGTGKTSLCKALSQKLAIHMSKSFPSTKLVEINAHSLFSRWFSESGKQVMLLFEHIRRIARDDSCLVCVLVDEVESLAAARQSAMKGNEPSDSIRVVNALLTQLDRLQRLRNVLVLVTSNLTGAIDVAFLDRADKKIKIGPPGLRSRRAVLLASMYELQKCGLLSLGDTGQGNSSSSGGVSEEMGEEGREQHADGASFALCAAASADIEKLFHEELDELAHLCEGFNGRMLKRLPFLAFSFYVAAEQTALLLQTASSFSSSTQQQQVGCDGVRQRCPSLVVMRMSKYLQYLRRSIENMQMEMQRVTLDIS